MQQDWQAGAFTHAELRASAPDAYAMLFDAVEIGPKIAPNRFYATSHSTGWDMNQINFERGSRGIRAEGGWGVVCTGVVPFEREATIAALGLLELIHDSDVGRLRPLVADIQRWGSLAGLQLGHMGTNSLPASLKVAPRAVSTRQTSMMYVTPSIGRAMTKADIADVLENWAIGAKRGREAGFDVIYVESAHGALPTQFLNPYYNHREDEYNGSLENRARFLIEALTAVRDAVGADCAIACRFAIETFGQGHDIEEALQVMRMADHLVDVWDLALAGSENAMRDMTHSRLHAEGSSVEFTRRAREATDKPVVGTGRFTDADLMAKVISDGDLDFIGAARPTLADPFIPRKIAAGATKRIRRCIGSNRCGHSQFTQFSCSQNATTGEEYRRGWHPENLGTSENPDDKVLIVGAGPAGLECATVLAARGVKDIRLVDEQPDMGGHLRWFTQLPGFGIWSEVVEHRRNLLQEIGGVEFTGSTRLDADAVLASGVDKVIVATGSDWAGFAEGIFDSSLVEGADASLPHVLTPDQIIRDGKPIPGKRVVVYDCQGDHMALAVTQYLQGLGHEVELASPFGDIGMQVLIDIGMPLVEEIVCAGGTTRAGATLIGVDEGSATFMNGQMEMAVVECDAVVLITRRASVDDLYLELASRPEDLERAGITGLFQIGDCVAPVDLSDVIFSGHRLARELDSPNPAVALEVARA